MKETVKHIVNAIVRNIAIVVIIMVVVTIHSGS